MSQQQNGFHFVVYPKTLIIKGIHNGYRLPHYSITIYRGTIKEDTSSIIPIRQQKLYHTCYELKNAKLQFTELSNINQCEQRKIIVYQQDKELGDFHLKIDQYLSNYQDYNTKFYDQRIKLTDNIDFQFQLFMANNKQELSSLLYQYRGESDLRTPITEQGREQQQQDDYFFKKSKIVESQIYSPTSLAIPKKISADEIDEQQSISSQVQMTAPPVMSQGFKINLKAVPPSKTLLSDTKRQSISAISASYMKEYLKIPWKDRLIFLTYAGISIFMIYLSMQPIKKI